VAARLAWRIVLVNRTDPRKVYRREGAGSCRARGRAEFLASASGLADRIGRPALCLPLPDDRDLLVDDIVGRQRMARNEKHEDVAGAEFLIDLRPPVGAAGHEPIEPEIDRPVFDRRPQIAGYERQPLHLALGGMLRLVGVGVADDDQRLSGLGRHGGSVAEL
jgi:hypothetical protein